MESETTDRPLENFLSVPYESWGPYLEEQFNKGWHYVMVGPICNCFTTCMSCEYMGYHTHKGADWGDGPWVKYSGPLEEWPENPFKKK